MNLLRNILPQVLGYSLLLGCLSFLYDAVGLRHLGTSFEDYHGDLSWAQYRVAFRPLPPGVAPRHPVDALVSGPDPLHTTFTVIRYGLSLTHHVPLRRADVLQSEIPLPDLTPVLYDTTRFGGFSPDSVYFAWVGLRGSYHTFPFGTRPVFVLRSYRAAAAPAEVPAYAVQTDWAQPWRLYAWAALLLQPLFILAAAVLLVLPAYRRPADRLLVLLLLLPFGAAAAYVDWCDYQTDGEWPIFKLLLGLGLLVGYGYQLRAAPPAPEAPSDALP